MNGQSHTYSLIAIDTSGNVSPPSAGVTTCSGFGTYATGNWPPSCWRPYSNTSPFNQRIPANPRLTSRSDQIVNRLLGFGQLQHLEVGLPDSRDYEHPTVYSRASDPLYTIHCKTYACTSIEGDLDQFAAQLEATDAARDA